MAMTSRALQQLPARLQQLQRPARWAPLVTRRAAFATNGGKGQPDKLARRSDDRALTPFWDFDTPSLFRPGRAGSLFRSLEEDLSRMFGDQFPAASVSGFGAADVQELDKAFTIKLDLPGMPKENIKVHVNRDNILTVSGKREHSTSKELPSGAHRRERSVGTFQRQFRLPDSADTSAITAKAEDGVLNLDIPKLESGSPSVTDIPVQGGESQVDAGTKQGDAGTKQEAEQ